MITTWIPPRLKALFRLRKPMRAKLHDVFRPRLESLEDRVVLTVHTWTGGAITNLWTNQFNWSGNVAPVASDDLVFPAGASRLTNVNDFPTDTLFNSITYSGSGYAVTATSERLNLGAGGIVNSAASGTNNYRGPILLNAVRTINVAQGGTLELRGVLSGSGGITKTGQGTLTFGAASANTYSGETTVIGGLLQLDNGTSAGPTVAIPGSLTISSPVSTTKGLTIATAEVRLLRADQIGDKATVTVTAAGNTTALFNLNGFSDAIGALNLTAGTVTIGAGTLTLGGNVTAQAGDTSNPARIFSGTFGSLALGSSPRTFTVNGQAGSVSTDLLVQAVLGGTLIKEGAGVMELDTGSVNLGVGVTLDVRAGSLVLDSELDCNVILRDKGTFGGRGAVSGNVSSVGGTGQTRDDATFTGTGWRRSTGQGFGNDFSQAPPSQSTGGVLTARWVFTNLPSGFYRVFATWTGGSDRSTGAPYSVFDGTTLRATASINQERAPAGGPHDGGVIFQQLGDPVRVNSGSLGVLLTNQVPTEADGAFVVADAVRIERLAGVLNPGRPGATDTMQVGSMNSLGAGSTYHVDLVGTGPGTNVADAVFSPYGPLQIDGTLLELASTSFSPPSQPTGYPIMGMEDGRFENLPNDGDTIDMVVGTQRHTFSIFYGFELVSVVYQNTATQVRDLSIAPDVINEGERVTLRGALTDPNLGDVLSLRVDWGDGNAQTFSDLGTKPFHFDHTYADNSPPGTPYEVRVNWFDQKGAGNSAKLFVTVNNLPPRLLLGGAEVIQAGDMMRHSASFTDPGADTFTATVDYGDGSGPQPLVVHPGQTLIFEHRYTKPGKYRVTVTVFDDDGGASTETFQVIVH